MTNRKLKYHYDVGIGLNRGKIQRKIADSNLIYLPNAYYSSIIDFPIDIYVSMVHVVLLD